MFRWNNIEVSITPDGKNMKYYRPQFQADSTVKVELKNNDLDKIANDELGSELEMYKIMDLNLIAIIENRGDLSRIDKVEIPAI